VFEVHGLGLGCTRKRHPPFSGTETWRVQGLLTPSRIASCAESGFSDGFGVLRLFSDFAGAVTLAMTLDATVSLIPSGEDHRPTQ
jgi:hypothetical protein